MSVYSKTIFGAQNLFSLATRERCLTNFRKLRIPKVKEASSSNAAVLIPMCNIENVPSLLYTVRSPFLRSNGGVISFPGGKIDKNETPLQTALRETTEEIGLAPTKVDVWGEGPAIPGKITITPVIGTLLDLKQQDLDVNTKEVSEVFGVSIEMLCSPKNQYYTQFRHGHILPVFIVENYKIWGVTAFITHCFLSSLLPKDVYCNDWLKRKIVSNQLTDPL